MSLHSKFNFEKEINNLSKSMQAIRAFVPEYSDGELDTVLGGANDVKFTKAPVKIIHSVSSGGKDEKNKPKHKEKIIQSNIVVVVPKRGESVNSAPLDKLREQKISSPFIQGYLVYGKKGKISKKANHDLHSLLQCCIKNLKNKKEKEDIEELKRKIGFEKIKEINVKELFAQLLLAVNELHSRGLVHRDIKPENILFHILDDGSIHLELADLDTIEFKDNKDMAIFGTEGYLAPEMLDRAGQVNLKKYKKCDKLKLDCYALGKSFLEIYSSQGSSTSIDFYVLAQALASEHQNLRTTVKNAMENESFGKTKEEREAYFDTVSKKFGKPKQLFYDNYYIADDDRYPEMDDAFILLPAQLKEIYQKANDLHGCLQVFDLQPPSVSTMVKFTIFSKIEQYANGLNEMLDKHGKKIAKKLITELKKDVVKILIKIDQFKKQNIIDLEKFNKEKELEKFLDEIKKIPDSQEVAIKQLLKFAKIDYLSQERLKKSVSAKDLENPKSPGTEEDLKKQKTSESATNPEPVIKGGALLFSHRPGSEFKIFNSIFEWVEEDSLEKMIKKIETYLLSDELSEKENEFRNFLMEDLQSLYKTIPQQIPRK